MRIEQSKPNITEYSFLRLLVSTLRSDYHEVIVAKHQLEKDLYTFYDDEDFNFLFEDVLKKESIEGNNYVDLSASFQMAYAWGLLSMIKDAAKDVRSVINLSEEEAIGKLEDYNEKQVNAMRELVYQIKEKEPFIKGSYMFSYAVTSFTMTSTIFFISSMEQNSSTPWKFWPPVQRFGVGIPM